MKERALALFFLAWVLFTPPFDLLPLGERGPWGLPLLYLYLFLAWGLVILLAYFLYRKP